MDLILTLLGLLLLLLVLAVVVFAAASAGLAIASGRFFEWLFDRLVPHRRTGVGAEDLIGERGTVIQEFVSPHASLPARGMVQIRGERWSARAAAEETDFLMGHPVRVVALDRLTLIVEPCDPRPADRRRSGRAS